MRPIGVEWGQEHCCQGGRGQSSEPPDPPPNHHHPFTRATINTGCFILVQVRSDKPDCVYVLVCAYMCVLARACLCVCGPGELLIVFVSFVLSVLEGR